MTYELWLLQGTPVTSLSMNGSQVTHDSRDPSRFVDPFDPWSMTHWSILGSAASTTHFYSEIWWRRHGTVCKLTSLVRVTTMKTLLISTVIRIVCLSKWTIPFLANVNSFSRSLYAIACPSVCLSSVVCNVRAPYSGGSNFRQYFCGIRYHGHPLTSTVDFTEIVPGKTLRRGVKHKRGSQV